MKAFFWNSMFALGLAMGLTYEAGAQALQTETRYAILVAEQPVIHRWTRASTERERKRTGRKLTAGECAMKYVGKLVGEPVFYNDYNEETLLIYSICKYKVAI